MRKISLITDLVIYHFFLLLIKNPNMPRCPVEIIYSDKYRDDEYEYRHVILPLDLYKRV